MFSRDLPSASGMQPGRLTATTHLRRGVGASVVSSAAIADFAVVIIADRSSRSRSTSWHIRGARLSGLGLVGASGYVYIVVNLLLPASEVVVGGGGIADRSIEDASDSMSDTTSTEDSAPCLLHIASAMGAGQRMSCLATGFALG